VTLYVWDYSVLSWERALIPKKKGRSLEGPGPFFVVFFVF
jgi:hypothetical protein